VQNTFTSIAKIKLGRADQIRQVLQALGQTINESPIAMIGTIHFARWVLIDNDTRLLFASHYDGTWDAYMEAFSTHTADALDAVLGHCVGYPKGGARNVEAFKRYMHEIEIKELLVFSSYPDASVKDIQRSLRTRALFESLLDEFQ
jgi:hypothetical protein